MHRHARTFLHTAALAVVVAGTLRAQPVEAQEQAERSDRVLLRGIVVDGSTGLPLHGAFVAPVGSDTGYLTHENGSFALPVLPRGTYLLYAELLGYETYQFQIVGPQPEPFTVTLRPDPIKLEGIRVLADRFQTRRRGVAVQVRAVDREDLIAAPNLDVVDYMEGRLGVYTSFCGGGGSTFAGERFGTATECVYRRGRLIQPTVYIDEVPAFGGLDELRQYRPQDLYTLEVYDRGSTVLAYTHHFVERVLRGKRRLMPLVFLR